MFGILASGQFMALIEIQIVAISLNEWQAGPSGRTRSAGTEWFS
jgi:hypothetical protein